MIYRLIFYELSKTWKPYILLYGLLTVSMLLLDTCIYWGLIDGAVIGMILFLFFSVFFILCINFMPVIRYYRGFLCREASFLLMIPVKRTTLFLNYFFISIFWFAISVIIYLILFIVVNAALVSGFVMSQVYEALLPQNIPFMMMFFGLVILMQAHYIAQATLAFSLGNFFRRGKLLISIGCYGLLVIISYTIMSMFQYNFSLILSFQSFTTLVDQNIFAYAVSHAVLLLVYFFLSMGIIRKNMGTAIK